jgi:hypothetical protein
VWAETLDGEAHLQDQNQRMKPLPTVNELSELSERIRVLTDELNEARKNGFLHEALAKRRIE